MEQQMLRQQILLHSSKYKEKIKSNIKQPGKWFEPLSGLFAVLKVFGF